MIRKIFTYCLLIAGLTSRAQVSVTANAPGIVDLNEGFQFSIVINAEPSGYKAPDLSAFNILSGPNPTSSSQISIINNNIKQSVSITYTYILQAKKAGKFNIEPAKVTVDGKSYSSNSLSIEVTDSRQSGNQQSNQNQQGNNQQKNSQNTDDKCFINVYSDKTEVFLGEYIPVTFKLYSFYEINLTKITQPKFNGFYIQELPNPNSNQWRRSKMNGRQCITLDLGQYNLFPQKSGALEIDPFIADGTIYIQVSRPSNDIFDFFSMQPQYKEYKIQIKNKPVVIHVKPLPAGAPASFKGAVGSYSFKASIDKNKVKTNDAISLKAQISGMGNIKLIDLVEPQLPADFETFDPKTNVSVKGVNGNKTFEFVMIPRHSGSYTIPALEFSYFDPQIKQYKILRSDAFPITVEKGKDDEDSKNVFVSSNRDDVKYLGKDILFIKPGPVPILKSKSGFFGSMAFYLSYGTAMVVFLLFVITKRKQIVENANIARVRNKQANKMAKKRLKTASKCMAEENKEVFYEEILKALWGYLGDKFNIPASELSREKVLEIFSGKGMNVELTGSLNNILDTCELARYAPAAAPSDLKEIYEKTAELISAFENVI